MVPKISHQTTSIQETVNLVTFTEEILDRKLYFLCSVIFGNVLSYFLRVKKRKRKRSSKGQEKRRVRQTLQQQQQHIK